MFKRGLDSMPKPTSRANTDGFILDFWLGYEEEAEIVFLDSIDNVPTELVHPLFFDKRQHLVACARGAGDDCPLCDYCDTLPKGDRNSPYPRGMAFFTILDLRPYVKDDGTEVLITKKLLKANQRTMEAFQREMESDGVDELRGSLWKFSRGKDTKPKPAAIGDRYRYNRKANLDKIVEQFDEALIEPFTTQELQEVVIYDMEKGMELLEQYKAATGVAAPKKTGGFSGVKLNL